MWMSGTVIGLGIALALVALYLLSCIRILNEYQCGVIFRQGQAMRYLEFFTRVVAASDTTVASR
jgi:regulator of protease activity HflC (stomatin/prohibitin superfamily)